MIRILSKDLVNKIAAGEVVERPASVVKELMENSLDAGATKLSVWIAKGGLEAIEVEDNGSGIEKDDISRLFHSHATSKIASIDDLSRIGTFGFRGEALASIASVSDILLLTKHSHDPVGSRVTYINGEIHIASAGVNQGTRLEIRNLFHSVPARRKFMKSEATESGYIVRIFQEIALMHPEVNFILYKNGKKSLSYEKSDMQTRVKEIVKADLLPYSLLYDGEQLYIEGSLTKPGNLDMSSEQFLFVNKRPVHSPILFRAIKEAYRSYLKKELKPSFVISITIDPSLIDVNVHPRKTEIRFLDQNGIYQKIYQVCIKQFENMHRGELKITSDDKIDFPAVFPKIQIVDQHVSLKRGKEDVQASLRFTSELIRDATPIMYGQQSADEQSEYEDTDFMQIDKKLIVFYDAEALHIVDQHAASERINLEKFSREFDKKELSFHVTLFPQTVEVSELKYVLALENKDEIAKFGIVIEDLGNGILSIPKYHTIIPEKQVGTILLDILEQIELGATKDRSGFEEKLLASIACRSAVMFGQSLSEMEMRNLIQALSHCRIPDTCAHGRPTQYILTKQEILKKLARC